MDIPKEQGLSHNYLSQLNKWTRKDTLFSGFTTEAIIYATYKSPSFIDTYQKEFLRVYGVEKQKKNLGEKSATSQNVSEFIVYAYTPIDECNDFDKRSSLWDIFVLDGDKKTSPIEIKKIETVLPEMESFYPYIKKNYGNCYSLKFKSLPQENGFKLVFVSTRGKIELIW